MIGVYKFHLDYGRQGELSGVFLAEADEIANIIGYEIHFGEALGKHSDVSAIMEDDMFKLVTSDSKIVDIFQKYSLSCGSNPLHYFDISDYDPEQLDEDDNLEDDDL